MCYSVSQALLHQGRNFWFYSFSSLFPVTSSVNNQVSICVSALAFSVFWGGRGHLTLPQSLFYRTSIISTPALHPWVCRVVCAEALLEFSLFLYTLNVVWWLPEVFRTFTGVREFLLLFIIIPRYYLSFLLSFSQSVLYCFSEATWRSLSYLKRLLNTPLSN